jgi:hypothetical protein
MPAGLARAWGHGTGSSLRLFTSVLALLCRCVLFWRGTVGAADVGDALVINWPQPLAGARILGGSQLCLDALESEWAHVLPVADLPTCCCLPAPCSACSKPAGSSRAAGWRCRQRGGCLATRQLRRAWQPTLRCCTAAGTRTLATDPPSHTLCSTSGAAPANVGSSLAGGDPRQATPPFVFAASG